MKKHICLLLVMLLVLGTLPGCQQTPEKPIVVGKNTENMLDAARVDDSQQQNGDDGVNLYELLNAPPTYSSVITSKMGKLTVKVDAKVELPNTELPIVRILPTEFTMEQVKLFAGALFGSDAKYVQGLDTKTKEAYAREIELLRDGIADWENVGAYLFDLQYYTKEEAEDALANLLKEQIKAPDTLPAYTPEFTWQKAHTWKDGVEIESTDSSVTLLAMPDDATYSWLNVINCLESFGTVALEYTRDFSIPLGAMDTNVADVSGILQISEKDACALAEKTIQDLGLTGFVCAARQGAAFEYVPSVAFRALPYYDFMFTRQIQGVTETYTNDDQTSGDGYNKPWYYEKIHVLIDDEGVLYVKYSAPYEIIETVMDAASLMPFDQIQDIFEKMVVIVDNVVDTGEALGLEHLEYHITTIRLGFISVREQNADTGMLIPVWDFLGYETYVGTNGESGATSTNELSSFLTINAVDGSIVQRGNPIG